MKLFDFKFLSQEYPLDEAFFVVTKELLKLNGIWPFTPMTRRLAMFWVFTSSCLLIGGAGGFAYFYKHLSDPLDALDCALPAVTISMTLFKYLYICYNRKAYRECITRCKELIFAGQYTCKCS